MGDVIKENDDQKNLNALKEILRSKTDDDPEALRKHFKLNKEFFDIIFTR